MAPESIGRYETLEKLGEGGLGVLYRALAPRLARTALKLIRAEGGDEKDRCPRR